MSDKVVGPRRACPACASTDVSEPKYCAPGSRAMTGFLVWCAKDGKHLHQKCRTCSFKWTGTPVEVK